MISVIIPHRDPITGLWATIASCSLALHSFEHEFIVCANGTSLTKDHERLKSSRVKILDIGGPTAPAAAREVGASEAKGDWLFFIDDHVIVPDLVFDRLFVLGKDIMYLPTVTGPSSPTYYHYIPSPTLLSDMDASQ